MSITFSQLVSAHAVHSTAEAVALVLAAVRACDAASSQCGQCFRLPDAAHIMLSNDGRVSFSTDLLKGTDVERVEHMSLLLRQLLGVGCERPADPADIPGALLLLIARGLRQIDLPPPSYVGLQDALMRFGSFNGTALSMVHARVLGADTSTLTLPNPIFRHRTAFAVAAGAAVVISVALMWMHQPATGLPRPDFVTVQTSDVRVPIDPPAAADVRNGSSRPQEARSAVPPRPLLTSVVLGADVFSPSFAPQGELLFHSGRHRSALMRATFDGAGTPAVTTLLQDGATNYHATVSPDGMWLSYDTDRDGTRGVYVARSDASEPRKISGDGYAAVPRWSPDGRRLAFLKAEDRRPRVWNVWVADLATGSTSRVSAHDVGQTWGASWFPDGRRLAYSVEDKLVLAHVDNAGFRVISSPRRGHLIRTPAVSPDGNYVVFQVHRDGGWLLDVVRGTVRRVLTDVAAEEFAWSPDGHRVVFHTRRNGAWSVWQLELDPKVVAGAL